MARKNSKAIKSSKSGGRKNGISKSQVSAFVAALRKAEEE